MRPRFPRRAPLAALALALPVIMVSVGTTSTAAAQPDQRANATRKISYHQWDDGQHFRRGSLQGTRVWGGKLRLADPKRQRRHQGTTYDEGRWVSDWVRPGFPMTQLIPSWSARTPRDSWIEVAVRGRDRSGRTSSWDVMARWTSGDGYTKRSTISGQADDLADVNVDTWRVTASGGFTTYQVRVALLRRAGARSASPSVDTVGAMASRLPARVQTSTPGDVRGVVLDVPRYSQMAHRGHYPQWGGGGEAWCSPTSTSMVLGYYDALPAPRAYRFVPAGHRDPWVDLAARSTYDHAYEGTGNWPFNTAYAAPRVGHAFVTRLRSLREAEKFIAAGIPLVASVTFGPGRLSGAPISSTNGHLLVVVGFDRSGDPVVNDPAASTRAGVRRTYDRAQFERAWLGRSGGLVYVIHDDAHPLPGGHGNW